MGEPSDESSLSDPLRSSARLDAENGTAITRNASAPVSQNKRSLSSHYLPSITATHGQATSSAGPTANSDYFAAGSSSSKSHDVTLQPAGVKSEHASPTALDTEVTGEKPAALDAKDGGNPEPKPPILTRMKAGIFRFGRHTKNALTRTIFNVLLVFVPIGIAANFAHLKPEIVFAMNAIAIIPLAGVLTHATEAVASRLGDTWGALLNVSFGNAVELIIFIIALVKNEIRIVQASLLGSILANLLLILGMAFLLGGLRYREQIYNNTVTQMSACLLSLSVVSLLLPTAFHASFSDVADADRNTLKISRGTSVVLLLVYILYLLFQLKSHAYLYESMSQEQIDAESYPGPLADVLDTSSSSSSSSSSSDTDTTSGSVKTSKRIKRYIRRVRRKSSASSADTPSLPSHVSSPVIEGHFNLDAQSRPVSLLDRSRRGSHHSALEDIMSGDEAELEHAKGHSVNMPRVKDFVKKNGKHADGLGSLDRSDSPEHKHGRRRHHRHHHRSHHHHKARKARSLDELDVDEKEQGTVHSAMPANPTSDGNGKQRAVEEPKATVNFSDEVEVQTADATPAAKRPFTLRQISTVARPEIRKFLTQNVFVAPPPVEAAPQPISRTTSARSAPVPALRRTKSLPDQLNVPQPTIVRRPLAPYVMRVPPPSIRAEAEEKDEYVMSRTAAVVMLLVSTGLVALCAEFLVDAIPAMTANSSNVSQAFIGLIILPIVGNAAEHVTAVTVAAKNKMDLAIGVAVGSSIQIALFVTPLVVILGWIMDKRMTLYFNLFETVSLFVTAFVVNFLVLDGKSNYLEGTLLIAAYTIIAVAAFFYPDGAEQSALGGSEAPAGAEAARLVKRLLGF